MFKLTCVVGLLVLSLSIAEANSVAVLCPLTADITYVDKATGETTALTLERTTASYGGEGGYGPRWHCDYSANLGVLRVKLVTGEATLGTRFDLLRADGHYTRLSLNRAKLQPGVAALEAFNSYEHQPEQVTAAQFVWDAPSRTATAITQGDFAFVTFSTDAVNGKCPRDLSYALQAKRVGLVLWGKAAERIFATLPGTPGLDPRLGERFKEDRSVRCALARPDSSGRKGYRCEMVASVESGALLLWNTSDAQQECVYAAGSELMPAQARLGANESELVLSGAAAEFMALGGGASVCERRPGSGLDTVCTIMLSH